MPAGESAVQLPAFLRQLTEACLNRWTRLQRQSTRCTMLAPGWRRLRMRMRPSCGACPRSWLASRESVHRRPCSCFRTSLDPRYRLWWGCQPAQPCPIPASLRAAAWCTAKDLFLPYMQQKTRMEPLVTAHQHFEDVGRPCRQPWPESRASYGALCWTRPHKVPMAIAEWTTARCPCRRGGSWYPCSACPHTLVLLCRGHHRIPVCVRSADM